MDEGFFAVFSRKVLLPLHIQANFHSFQDERTAEPTEDVPFDFGFKIRFSIVFFGSVLSQSKASLLSISNSQKVSVYQTKGIYKTKKVLTDRLNKVHVPE